MYPTLTLLTSAGHSNSPSTAHSSPYQEIFFKSALDLEVLVQLLEFQISFFFGSATKIYQIILFCFSVFFFSLIFFF